MKKWLKITLIVLSVIIVLIVAWIVIRIEIQKDDVIENWPYPKCLESQVVATKVTPISYGNPELPWETNPLANSTYSVTLERTAGEDEIEGVKLVFQDDSQQNYFVLDAKGNILKSEQKIVNVNIPANFFPTEIGGYNNPTKVIVVVYFIDEDGRDLICQAQNSLDF
jgi:hypothetical protein